MLIKWFGAFVVASTVLTVGAVTDSFAQNAPSNFPAPTGGPVSAPAGGPGYAPASGPSGAYAEGVAAGPWYLFPSIFVGGVYDSNISQSAQGSPVEFWLGCSGGPTYDRHV